MTGPVLLPLPGAEAFTDRLVQAGGLGRGAMETRRFPDGEHYVRLSFDPAGCSILIVGEMPGPDDRFLTLAFVADALRDLGARRIGLVAPYLGYLRQDARFLSGEAVTSRSFARLLAGLVDDLVTVDPHLHRFATLDALYTIPARTLHAAPLMGQWIAREIRHPLVIGPDAESRQWACEVAAHAGAPLAVLDKQRLGDRDVRIRLPDLAPFAGRQPVLVDDIAASGRTLVAASAALRDRGFAPPVCVVVHALFGGDAFAAVSAVAGRVVSTDTIAHPTNAIPVAPLIAKALSETGAP